MPKEEHSSIWYSRSSTKDFMNEHGRSSASILGTFSFSWTEPNGNSYDDGQEGCVLICTDRKSAALLKSAEWQISLGEDGNRPSVSELLWRDCEQAAALTFPCEGYELVEGVEQKPFSGLWYLYGETGLVGRLSEWDKQVFIGVSQNLESSESSDIGEYCHDISSLER